MKPAMRSNWTLVDARTLVTELEGHLKPHYHVALAGSVLLRGASSKDIDIFVFPHTTAHYSLDAIHEKLKSFGFKSLVTNEGVEKKWKKQGSTDEKFVDIWMWQGKRVDVFYPWKTRE